VRCRIRVVALVWASHAVGIHCGVPADAALDRLRIRIQQQLGRVAAVPASRVIRAVDPVPVPLARSDARQVAMPDVPVHLVQRHPGLRAVVVEQAQFHLLGYLREQGEVSPRAVITRPQRVTVARPHRRVCCHRSALPLMPATTSPCPPVGESHLYRPGPQRMLLDRAHCRRELRAVPRRASCVSHVPGLAVSGPWRSDQGPKSFAGCRAGPVYLRDVH
jgi:hypothetical protein